MRLVAKHSEVGYLSPQDRESCRNCEHRDEWVSASLGHTGRSYCFKHAIEVAPGGVCATFRPVYSFKRRSAGASPFQGVPA